MNPELLNWINLLNLIAALNYMVYCFAGTAIIFTKPLGYDKPIYHVLWLWSKYPALGAVILAPIAHFANGEKSHWWLYLLWVWNFIIWYLYSKIGDDDINNKLKKRLMEKVQELHGRLVIVPASA